MTDTDRKFLTYDEAVARLPDGDEIHTFTNPAVGLLLGADWSREQILEAFKADGAEVEESGPAATAAKHGIAMKHNGRFVFVATKEQP